MTTPHAAQRAGRRERLLGPAGRAWDRIPARVRKILVPAVILVLLGAYPSFYQPDSVMPTVGTAVIMCIFTIMALGLNIVVGYAGLLDLGYVAFYAAGAYVAGWFASQQFVHHNVHVGAVGISPTIPGYHISGWILLVVGALFAAFLGIIIGLPTLRLRGDYLAIVTLGFGEIIPQVVRNGDNFFGTGFNLTNGPNGLTPIDTLGFGDRIHAAVPFLPAAYSLSFSADNLFYWTALALVCVTIFCSLRLRDSRLGRAWVAIREDEIAAAAMGIPLMRVKTWAYAIGAFFGGMAGCYFAIYKSGAFPSDFFLNISIFILCMVILGGMGNVWGVCVGGAFLAYLDSQGLASIGNTFNDTFGTNIEIPKYEFLIFGLIIVATMLLRPQGLIPSARRKAEFEHGVEGGTLYDASG
jgi:branched-chain amino acid transport system permease protein